MAQTTGSSGSLTKRVDSVDCIMDKIDSELSLLNALHGQPRPAVPSGKAGATSTPVKCESPVKALDASQKCPIHSGPSEGLSQGSSDTMSSNVNEAADTYEGESIASLHTEEFETAFRNVMVQQQGTDAQRLQNLSSISSVSTSVLPVVRGSKNLLGTGACNTAPSAGAAGQAGKAVCLPDEYISDDTETCDELSDLEMETAEPTGNLHTGGIVVRHDVKFSSLEEEALVDEISKQSLSILKEIQKERLLRQRSSAASRAQKQEQAQIESSLSPSSNEDQVSLEDMKQEKLLLLLEISSMRKTAQNLEETINQMEHLAKSNQARAEEARSQLMVAEFKKRSLTKDVEKLTAELQSRQTTTDADGKRRHPACKSPLKESPSPLGKHFAELVEERNRLAHTVEQQQRVMQLEKKAVDDELLHRNNELLMECKKLTIENAAKEQEQKSTLTKLDSANCTIADLKAKLLSSEARVKRIQEESTRAIQEKSKEIEDVRSQTQKDMIGIKAEIAAEVTTIVTNHKLSEDRLSKYQYELAQKNQEIDSLRLQINELQASISSKTKETESLEKEYKSRIQSLTRNKNEELTSLRKQAAEQSRRELATQKELLEGREKQSLLRVAQEHSAQVETLQKSVEGKEIELSILRQTLAAQEDSFQKALKVVRLEEQQKFDETLSKERNNWEQEWQDMYQQQVTRYKEDLARHVQQLREQFECERTLVQQLQQKNLAATKELQELRRTSARSARDNQGKLDSSAKTIKSLQDDLEKTKAKLEKEKATEVRHLTEALDHKDRVVDDLKQQHDQLVARVKEANATLEKMKDAVVVESNEECSKIASILGITPCKVETSRILLSDSLDKKPVPLSITLAALANLRACNEELRNYVEELKSYGGSTPSMRQDVLAQLHASCEEGKGRAERPDTTCSLGTPRPSPCRQHGSANPSASSPASAAINAELSRQLDIYLNRRERQQIKSMVDGPRTYSSGSSGTTQSQLMSRSLRSEVPPDGGSAYKDAILKKLQHQLRQVHPYVARRPGHSQRSSSEHSISLNDLSLLTAFTHKDIVDHSLLLPHTRLMVTPDSHNGCDADLKQTKHSRRSTTKGSAFGSKPPLSRLHSQSLSSL